MNVTAILLIGSLLLMFGVLASKISSRLGIPALLLFLIIGMLAGSEGLGGIAFDTPELAMFFGTLALCLILFDGGLRTDVASMNRRVVRDAATLATVGVVLTALGVGAFATVVLGLGWIEALLLGAVLSSTDAAAVFSVLRARGIGLPHRLRSLLELESGSNDPTAVFLVTSLITLARSTQLDPWLLLPLYLYAIVGGVALGWAFGRGLTWLLDRIDLEHEGLYPVLTLSAVGVVFGAAQTFGVNGFMAVYVAGLTLAGRVFLHRNSLMRFHDGLAWLMQISMFLMLGLLVFPSRLVPQGGIAILTSLGLIVVVRPAAVFIALSASRMTVREKLLVSWVGLRGAAPIILATFVLVARLPGAQTLFDVVFFAVILSVLLQGPTVGWVTRRLGLAERFVEEPPSPLEVNTRGDTGIRVHRLVVAEGAPADGERLLTIGGPSRPLVVMLRRGDRLFVPTGGSRLEAGDELFVLGDADSVRDMRDLVSATAFPARD